MSLLEQNIINKEQVKKMLELNGNNNIEEYEVEAIWDSAVYAKKLGNHLPNFYYLVAWKGYPKGKNTLYPILAV